MADVLSIKNSEQIERIRKAVLKLGGTVTVGDVMTETGLGYEETKSCLSAMMSSYEGTMRVSEKGEILYAFARGGILRDQRSWWERNKKAIMKMIKTLFKVIIMLVLVVYFIIFMCILIAILLSGKNRNSRIDIGWIFYAFWGRGSYETGVKKDPLYTRVYNFVFGPEDPEIDPLEARTQCAQLIRAKNGIITTEDWMMISGQSYEKCESDLARFTAEFDGEAEITDNGTLIYVFENMVATGKEKFNKNKTELPVPAWDHLEQPRPLSGNSDANGGDGAVIGLNLFNLIMSLAILFLGPAFLKDPNNVYTEADLEQINQMTFWLGIFPLIFSSLIFAGPLVRLPGNIRENRERRERAVHNAVLSSVFKNKGAKSVTFNKIVKDTNHCLLHNSLPNADHGEVSKAINSICGEIEGEVNLNSAETSYTFDNMNMRMDDAEQQRHIRKLDEKGIGRVVYSSDTEEQYKLDEENEKADMDEFDKLLMGDKANSSEPEYGNYQDHSSQSSNNAGFEAFTRDYYSKKR